MADTIRLSAHLDNPHFLKTASSGEAYLLVELNAIRWENPNQRLPLNISVVIDRSGSMAGEKLDYAKKATQFLVQNLQSSDYLSVVQYDDQVDVVSASALVANKTALLQKISEIRENGMTNLSGGMLEGYAQVNKHKAGGYVHRVLLLSDGLANVGVTDNEQLKKIAEQHFRNQGIGLSSFGLGAGFNELLMTGLAECGGANYYFIESPDQIPQIFASELQGLLSVVAQNTKLRLSWTANSGLRCEQVFGYNHRATGENQLEISFNDLFSEESKAVLCKFRFDQAPTEPVRFEVELDFSDAVQVLGQVRLRETLTLSPTTDTELIASGVHKPTLENAALFVANDWYEQAILLVDKRQTDSAKNLLEKTIAYLEAHVKLFPESAPLRTLLDQVRAYLQNIPSLLTSSSEDYAIAQKTSRMANYEMKKRKSDVFKNNSFES